MTINGILYFIAFVAFVILFFMSVTFRCAILHPFKVIINGYRDLRDRFKYQKWNDAPYGKIIGYISNQDGKGKKFGCGKTLTGVDFIVSLYKKYNGKKVYCPRRKKMVTQKVVILSNVTLKTIPYITFTSLGQFVSYLNERYTKDMEEDVLTVVYGFIDEASSILNSRSFKDNFSALAIQSLLTQRHFHSSLIYSSQNPEHVDKLLRSVTSYYAGCDKLWRFQRIFYFDPGELEYATNPTMVKPFKRECWFVENKHYAQYDTFELLQDIDKKCSEGDMLTEEEILNNLQMPEPNADGITKPSRSYRKSRKKLKG